MILRAKMLIPEELDLERAIMTNTGEIIGKASTRMGDITQAVTAMGINETAAVKIGGIILIDATNFIRMI